MNNKPNILFIMADDHAAKAISCYGHGLNETPNIDRIAREGMLFNHCYVTNSICTPSRASILTGTYNHVNGVTTLDTPLNNRLPNVAKHLQAGGYQTAIIGKWHLGEGKEHEPSGFDYWSVLPGQGDYFDPHMIQMGVEKELFGYTTDLITEQCINWLDKADTSKPFFLMCHHKAPHREWEPHPKYRSLFPTDITIPSTFDDDYRNRAKAAAEAKMRIKDDMTYDDLGLVQSEGGKELGHRSRLKSGKRKIPNPVDLSSFFLIDKDTGERFSFKTLEEFHKFKYQRYIKRYLRTIASIDESVGTLLEYLDDRKLTESTVVIYTSDQGFFLGDHGWFDKRFMYEESLQMPFLIKYPKEIPPSMICNSVCCNVDFAPTFLDFSQLPIPNYMQGNSIRPLLLGQDHKKWSNLAYHRYWMHKDADHNAYAHYGIRDENYKLIYWYNEGFDLPGTNEGGEDKEWELFDCKEDPLELFNVAKDSKYSNVLKKMKQLLEEKMLEIGDIPCH